MIVAWPTEVGGGAKADKAMPGESDTEDDQFRRVRKQAERTGYLDRGYARDVINLHLDDVPVRSWLYVTTRGWVPV